MPIDVKKLRDMRKIAFFCLIVLLPLALSAQEADEELVEQELDWESVEGAWGYEVILRAEGEEQLRSTVRESRISFSLLPGEYEVNIHVLNKFKKSVSSTGWQPLTILQALQPVIREFEPRRQFLRSSGNLELKAQVYQVRENTRFYLSDPSGKEVDGRHKIEGGEEVSLRFPMDRLEPGEYILSAEDPSGLTDRADAFPLTLLPVIRPVAEKVEIRNLTQGEVYKDIEITGRNFEEGLTVRIFRKGSEFEPYKVEWESENLIKISLITGNNAPGRYNLEITNPSGETGVRENSFFLEEAPEVEIVSEVPPMESLSLLGGLTFAIPVEASHGDPEPVPFGLLFKARHELANSLFWKSPGLRYLGLELAIDTNHLKYKSSGFTYNQLFTGFSLYYRLRLVKGWSLIPRIGTGVTLLRVGEEGLFKAVQGDAGYGVGCGGSLQKALDSGLLFEGGLDYRYTRYTGGSFHTLHPWIAGGYRF